MTVASAYDFPVVLLSILIAVLASYTALDLGGRVRAATGRVGWGWIAAASIAMGGGIWSMHFVAMLAFVLPMPVSYDLGLTAASLLLAVVVTAGGFTVAGRHANSISGTMLSGTFMGLGIVGMHYTGMAAMEMPAHLHYHPALVGLSVVIAVGAATAALWLALRQTSLPQKIVASIAMGLAISGMHYTGMAAATFTAMQIPGELHRPALQQTEVALGIGGATVLILCLGLAASFVDRQIAELAEREALSVRQAERHVRLLVQNVRDYAIFMLDPEGHVTSWNAGAQNIKGYTADEIIGQHFSRFYTEEEIEAGEPGNALATALRDGKCEWEGWRKRKDGGRFWASVVIDVIHDEDGTLVGFAEIVRDLTERRATERALHETREQLFQAQKMEAVGLLTGGAAHDFNNLLTVVMGNLELANRALESGAPLVALRNIDRAQASADRAATLIDRLLTFARRQTLQPRLVDPNKLVSGISNMIESVVGENIGVETVLAGGAWRINVDQNRLESALLNLVINARDAIDQRGNITIETANSFLDAAYAAGEHEVTPGQYVLVAVSDTGRGMTREVISHAFEPFYTTKEVGQGSGLGLSQVFGFVKQSGGHVKIYSEVDQGTTIRMYLPRYVGGGQVLPEQRATQATLLKTEGRETILVVEDEAEVRAYACDVLTQLGYRVLDARDGRSGLAVLQTNPDIALLLTDVGLPGMNGRDLATEALQHRPDLRVLYMTGYAANAILHNSALDPGAQLLTKPFNMAELSSRISDMLRPVSV